MVKCPKKIAEMMERLKQQPPPTPEEVDRQMKASIRIRKGLRENVANKGSK